MVSVWFCTTVKCKLTFLGLLNSSSQRFSINTVGFCLNVGVGTAPLLWQLGDSDVPHLSGVLSVPQALKQLIPSALNILKSLQSSPQTLKQWLDLG